MKNFYRTSFIFSAALLLLSGCVSLMEKTGQILDGSAFAEKSLSLYRASQEKMEISVVENRDGDRSLIIVIEKFPMMKIRASMPDQQGNFYFLSLEYLAGSVHGWNEYSLELLGAGSLDLSGNAILSVNEEIEPVQITAGRIHSYDTRITGGEALTSLRSRRERISSLVEWMASVNIPQGSNIDEFEKNWKPVLFPETVSAKKRPDGWLRDGDLFTRADSIRWNTGYTNRVFPEELRPVRDSSTLLRDWEEALSWIYLEYEWESIAELLSRRIILLKVR